MTTMRHTDPEMKDIAALVQFVMDDERTTVTRGEIAMMARNLPFDAEGKALPLSVVNDMVLAFAAECGFDLRLADLKRAPKVRGFNSWDNNRYAGNECAGGSGYEQINGFAGQEG